VGRGLRPALFLSKGELRPQGGSPLKTGWGRGLLGPVGIAGPVWEGVSGRRFIRPCRRVICGFSAKEPQSVIAQNTPGLEQSSRVSWRPYGSMSDPWARQPMAHTGSGAGLATACLPGLPTPRACRHWDHLPWSVFSMGLGHGVTPVFPGSAEMSATKDRTQRGLSRTRAKCWRGMRAGPGLVKCLLGII
jgi:hypothetical protein